MYIELTGCLGHIQVIFKKFIDCGQCFLIERIRQIFAEDFGHKHFAQRNRELIDQTANAEVVVRYHVFVCVENFSYFECHLRLFVRTRYTLDLVDRISVGNAHLGHGLRIQHIHQHSCGLVHIFEGVGVFQFFYNNNALLIDRGDKILRSRCEQALYGFLRADVFFHLRFYHENNAAHVGVDAQLFRTVIDIHQKEVVKKKILDKVVFVQTLFVCNDEVLNLAYCNFSDHVSVIAAAFGDQNVLYVLVVIYFKIMIFLYNLAVRSG